MTLTEKHGVKMLRDNSESLKVVLLDGFEKKKKTVWNSNTGCQIFLGGSKYTWKAGSCKVYVCETLVCAQPDGVLGHSWTFEWP